MFNGGTFRYTGGNTTTNRSLQLLKTSTLDIKSGIVTMNGVVESTNSSADFTIDGGGQINVGTTKFFGYTGATILRGSTLYLSNAELSNKGIGSSSKLVLAGGQLSTRGENEAYETYSFPIEVLEGTTSQFSPHRNCYIKSRVSGTGTLQLNIPYVREYLQGNWNDFRGRLIARANSSGNLLLIGGLILALMWVNIDLIFAILPNGATYAVARHTVLLLGIGQLCVATFQFTVTALSYSRYYPFTLLFSLVLTILALLLNHLFIPRWGIDGAALATLTAQVTYYLIALITVRLALGSRIFTRRHLLTILLLVLLFAANALCLRYLPVGTIWLSSLLRTLLVVAVAALAYQWRISPEINEYIHALFHRIRL